MDADPPPPPPIGSRACTICLEQVDPTGSTSSSKTTNTNTNAGLPPFCCPGCDLVYCRPCLRRWLLDATAHLALHPVRCGCGRDLAAVGGAAVLSREEATTLRLRCEEWHSPAPLYCPVPTCSAYVPDAVGAPGAPGADDTRTAAAAAECPRCGALVCRVCHGLGDDECHIAARASGGTANLCHRPPVYRDAAVAAALLAQGCKLCPHCRSAVERLPGGCDEVECLACGQVFCFRCLGRDGDGDDDGNCGRGDGCCCGVDAEEEVSVQDDPAGFHEVVWRVRCPHPARKGQIGRQFCWWVRRDDDNREQAMTRD